MVVAARASRTSVGAHHGLLARAGGAGPPVEEPERHEEHARGQPVADDLRDHVASPFEGPLVAGERAA